MKAAKSTKGAKFGGFIPPNGGASVGVPKGKMPEAPRGTSIMRKDAKKPVKVFKKGGKAC